MARFVKFFDELQLVDLPSVGGKNSSLGEMYNNLAPKGVKIPYGFATTADAYREYIAANGLEEPIRRLLDNLDRENFSNLAETGAGIRELMEKTKLPDSLCDDILSAYARLSQGYGTLTDVAVRSSATAEDLPTASFAGQHESYLNIEGNENLLDAVHRCYLSLFTDRAIKYREDQNFDHLDVALSVGVQKMVRSDRACSGVAFTLEPESGFQNVIHIAGSWGLGENIVQGIATPDEFYVFKSTLREGKNAIVSKKLGSKAEMLVYGGRRDNSLGAGLENIPTPAEKRDSFVLSDGEIMKIAEWALIIEEHYGKPMDIEWAKDGFSGEIYIVQARPETVHARSDAFRILEYTLMEKGKLLASGNAIGSKISSGIARILNSPEDAHKLQEGDILVTDITSPDWDPILKKASAIVTNKGGRTSHASIVARELGVVAVVGAGDATEQIADGQLVTVSCAEGETGNIYDGLLSWEEREINFHNIEMPAVKPMMIIGDPDKAFKFAMYPNEGVGLMRLEFIINNAIKAHPMALLNFDNLKDAKAKEEIAELTRGYADKKEYFVDKLAQAVATIACAYHPRDVIVRMSDFKSNEYANLLGGREFELPEENPMIGFRGASRYYHERYREGFRLECEAMKKVRDEMGLSNVKLMIPFCRTVEEGRRVIALMEEYGLRRGRNGLEIYVMIELPSNVMMADEFAAIFDGFSIGSNDLTQLTLGIDRDSALVSELFDERNPAVMRLIAEAIAAAKRNGIKVGLCGQAPSDHPEFAHFLVEQGIDSIAFNPDALMSGIENINMAGAALRLVAA